MTLPVPNIVNTVATSGTSTQSLLTIFQTRAPTSSDLNYLVSQRWINTTNNKEYILLNFTTTGGIYAANWQQLAQVSGVVQYLAGNSGGDVGPTAGGVINVVGDGTTINIVGNPATNTLTASLIGTGAIEKIIPDSGTNPVVPAAGAVTITGNSTSITTVGGTNTLTVELTGLTNHNVLVGAGTATITKVAPSATSGVPLISQGSSSDPAFGTAVVAGGGTGDTSFTAYAPICGGTTTTGSLQSASTGLSTSGYVLTSNGNAALPSFQAVSASGAVTSLMGNSGTATPSSGIITVTTGASNASGTALFTGASHTLTLTATDSNANTGWGTSVLSSLTVGDSANCGFGYQALMALTSGGANTCMGYDAGYALTSGGKNTLIGSIAGTNYTSSESNNIILGNNIPGTASESYVCRIGNTTGSSSPGDINKCFIQGIYGQNSSGFTSPLPVYIDSSNGQLGYGSNGGLASSFVTDSGTATPSSGEIDILGQATPNVTGVKFTASGHTITGTMFSPFKGNFTFTQSTAATAEILTVQSTDNTSTSSNAQLALSVGGTSGGDPFVSLTDGTNNWALGMRHGASGQFQIAANSALGSSVYFSMNQTSNGAWYLTPNGTGPVAIAAQNASLSSATSAFIIQKSVSGGVVGVDIRNMSDTNGSNAEMSVVSNTTSGSGCSAYYQVQTNVSPGYNWSWGLNNSTAGLLQFIPANAFSGTEAFSISQAGVVKIADTWTLPTSAGTNNYVLTTNGTSAATWAAVSGSGAITTIDGDSGSATPSSGVVTISGGSTGLTTSGSSHTLSLTGTLIVGNGGTGDSSFTAYMPVCGGTSTTGALQSVSTSGASAGYVLTYVSSSALPTWQAASGASFLVQQVRTSTSSATSTATNIPYNTSVPTTSTGAQLLSVAITPTNSSHILRLHGVIYGGGGTGTQQFTVALFEGAGTNAIFAASSYAPNQTVQPVTFDYYMTAGTTSSTTFYVYYGVDSGTAYVNQGAGGQTLGGVFLSTFYIDELTS